MKVLFICILIKLFQNILCNGPGLVFVEFILYQNPSGKTEAGKDCDSWFHQFVSDRCDLVFTVCVKDANLGNRKSTCDVGYLSTLGHVFVDTQRVVFGKMIGFIPNPFNFSLISMPESVNIKVNVSDDDPDGQELISQLDHTIQLPLVTDMDYSSIQKIVLSSKFSELSFKVYGKCAQFYYGAGCLQYCKPSFSQKDGHYACDKVTGEKHCLIGWTGENCRQRDYCQMENPCHGGSVCSMNASVVVCECPPTLTGQFCSMSIRPCDSNPCLNGGLCVRSNESLNIQSPVVTCNCPHNFTGPFCEKDVNECYTTSNPCKNGAKCVNTFGSFYCTCDGNYWGLRCEKPPVYSVMGLDGSYIYKDHPSAFANNVIIILLAIVACLILLVVILSLLYLKNRHMPSLVKSRHSGSELSVYSQCHYEEIEEKIKVDNGSYPCEEEAYPNIYEEQSEYSVGNKQCLEGFFVPKKVVSKGLSETCI